MPKQHINISLSNFNSSYLVNHFSHYTSIYSTFKSQLEIVKDVTKEILRRNLIETR